MSRYAVPALRRLPPPSFSHPTVTSTQILLSRSRAAPVPRFSHSSSLEPRPEPPTHFPRLRSPATYSSIISHAASPSILTTKLLPADFAKAKLTPVAAFFQKNPQFLYSAAEFRDHPFNEHVPEIVVLGASNVGKSTFLNAVAGQPGMARTSPRPGLTTVMNAYGVGPVPRIPRQSIKPGTPPPRHSVILVDTPGYGYKSQATWGDTVVKYLGARRMLRGAVLLLSADKASIMPEDKWLLEALADANVRTMVVVTKADKARQGEDWAANCREMTLCAREELKRIQKGTGRDWKEDAGWSSDIYVTAARLGQVGKKSNRGGVGGVREAILEMAGFKVGDAVEKQPENISYTGNIVSFDDIVWKS